MKLQNLTIIFIIIIIPVILLVSLYISTGLKTIKYQSLYDTGLLNATTDAIYAFEQNTANNEYSANPETKRDILKASVKMFEKSLCTACNINAYDITQIEEYIPAIVFGMYDGFYMYAPSYNHQTQEYKHNLKNYVYYSETLMNIGKGSTPVDIRYSLDNYVTVIGEFDDFNGVKGGYLIDLTNASSDGTQYKGISINEPDAINYYKEAYEFTVWFNAKIRDRINFRDYLYINSDNDPEDPNSPFNVHKRSIIKQKIEGVLNSSITAYSQRSLSKSYKMPKLSEDDWQKIYSNISMITFFQGKKIGLTNYNGYCVANSRNNTEYVNPNLMYFTDSGEGINVDGWYHDIRCQSQEFEEKLKEGKLVGHKTGDFKKLKVEVEKQVTNEDGTISEETVEEYRYKYYELACYECINGQLGISESVYEYINTKNGTASDEVKELYWTYLAKERYNKIKKISNAVYKTASQITSSDYGAYVTNYNPSNGSSVGWRIFHSDGNNIYLIADNYIELGKVPNIRMNNGKRGFRLDEIINNYEGSVTIRNQTVAKRWLKEYFNGIGATEATDNAIKATAYLLDTETWKGFKDNNYADYAIGGPTIELFEDSYNQLHVNRKIEAEFNFGGYVLLWYGEYDNTINNNLLEGIDPYNGLYIISDNTNAYGYYIASPSVSTSKNYYLYATSYNNKIDDAKVVKDDFDELGLGGSRPVVALNSDVKLERQYDGTYKLSK